MSVPRSSPRDRRIAELGLLLTVAIWSANFVVVKAAIGEVGPLAFTTLRYVIAAATMFTIVRWRTGSITLLPGLWWKLMLLGMLGFGCYQVAWTLGLSMISAGDSALIVSAAPVLTVLLAGAVGMDRLTGPKVLGAMVAFAGVAVVVTSGQLSVGSSLLGDALTMAAAVFWAVYTVLAARMLRHVDPLQAIAWSVLGGMLFLLPFGLLEVATTPPASVSAAAIAGVLYSGMLAAGTANVFVFHAITIVGPARASAAQFLVPFGAVLLGALVLSEPVGLVQLAGGAVIIAGVALTRRRTILPRRPAPPRRGGPTAATAG
jgi:drug/metabolite transporter (DMT)-like permease